MKPVNPQYLEKTLAWLKAGAPHVDIPGDGSLDGFYMGDWVQKNDAEDIEWLKRNRPEQPLPVCGTVCCIAGAVHQFEHEAIKKFKSLGSWTWPVITLVGMTFPDATDLFTPLAGNEESLVADKASRTKDALWAARVLQKYIDEGVVDWAGCEEPDPMDTGFVEALKEGGLR